MRLVRYTPAAGGPVTIGLLRGQAVEPVARPDGDGDAELLAIAMSRSEPAPIGDAVALDAVSLLTPLARPTTIRDFLTFEQHYRNFLLRSRGTDEVPAEWFRTPVFYFTHPNNIFGDGDEVPRPDTDQLDYELEVAAVLGADGRDVTPAQAPDLIAGYTLFNDYSARDIAGPEMSLGLGASKCKDFANVIGPCLATPDELGGTPGRPDTALSARVNGKPHGGDRLASMHHSFADMIAHASTNSWVRAGDVLGSGTCATGCLLELSSLHGEDAFPWLAPGDVVELEAEGIGTLTTTVGPRPALTRSGE
jgi:fumarylacetoacetate (FAA) hydrolase